MGKLEFMGLCDVSVMMVIINYKECGRQNWHKQGMSSITA